MRVTENLKNLIQKIEVVELARRKEKLLQGLDKVQELISSEIHQNYKTLIKEDFEFFKQKGRFWIHNTFAGGVIFLREPETIEGIKIDIDSETENALVKVEYSSENRNKRNVKHKPDADKVESTEWNMKGIFPNFREYDNEIQILLIVLIARFVKVICEDLHQNSWFMKYEKDFDLEIYLNKSRVISLQVEKNKP